MDSAGSNQNAGPNSVSGMVSTLIPSFLIACLFVVLFLFLRTRVQRIYLPRTFLGSLSQHEKSPHASPSLVGWIPEFLRMDDEYVLSHHSLDAYFFLRFWRQIIIITGLAWPVTWIILMPVYGTSHAGEQQFDKISFSNIDANIDANRLYAVSLVSWIVFGAAMFIIGRECIFSHRVRQAFMRAPGTASRLAPRTVLFTGVPSSHLSTERTLRELFPSVKTIWYVRDTKALDELVEERDKCAYKLEGALVKMSKVANDRRRKLNSSKDSEGQTDAMQWVEEHKKPTHRTKPIIGKKVDTVPWCQEQLESLIPRVAGLQAEHLRVGKEVSLVTAVIIEFHSVEAAHAAFYRTKVGGATSYTPRAVGLRPEQYVWKNLSMSPVQRKLRMAVAIAIICVMIIFWGPITAFIGAVSNINSLTDKVSFLSFINAIPGPLLGVVTGLLPTILLAVALVLVPIIMRLLFKLAGGTTLAEIELKTQTWYFVFQVIQVFLITTIASGAAATVTAIIDQPGQAPTLLAQNLPKASNFYINYFVLYGLALAAKTLFNIVAVLLYFILGKFLDKTPRKMYNRYIKIAGLGWGSIYPKFTNLAVIAITYSCISPLVLAFATIGFVFLAIAFKYAVVYSVDTSLLDTQGQAYTKALQQLTTGVYLGEVCLIGLMGISTGSSTAATGPLVLSILALVGTIIFHVMLNRALASIEQDVASDFNQTTASDTLEKQGAVHENAHPQSDAVRKAHEKNANFLIRLLRVPATPRLSSFLQSPIPPYSEEERDNAYLNPSISSPAPILWLVRDNAGDSKKQIAAVSKTITATDEAAWWDEKTGKLTTVWSTDTTQENENALRQAPIWEKKILY